MIYKIEEGSNSEMVKCSKAEVVAEFEKISFEQYLKDLNISDDSLSMKECLRQEYENIKLPQRSTTGSAGYDFFVPKSFSACAGDEILIHTGIRVKIKKINWFLMIAPRSSLGFKYGMRFLNCPPIIDADYFYANNEGHIMLKFTVSSNMCLQAGDKFAQGVFLPYGITVDDNAVSQRYGGIGSTGK